LIHCLVHVIYNKTQKNNKPFSKGSKGLLLPGSPPDRFKSFFINNHDAKKY